MVVILQAVWGYKNGYLAACLLHISNYKINPAIACTICLSICSWAESIRHVIYISRNLPADSGLALGNTGFGIALGIALVIAIATLTQSMLGLGVAWIDVADKSKNLSNHSTKWLQRLKVFVKGFMVVLTMFCVGMAILNMSNETAFVGIFLCVVLCPLLLFGGMKLNGVLGGKHKKAPGDEENQAAHSPMNSAKNKVKEAKDFVQTKKVNCLASNQPAAPAARHTNLAETVQWTYRHLTLSMLMFCIGAMWTTISNQKVYDTGLSGWNGTESSFAVTAVALGIWGCSFTICVFFERCNAAKLSAFREEHSHLTIWKTHINRTVTRSGAPGLQSSAEFVGKNQSTKSAAYKGGSSPPRSNPTSRVTGGTRTSVTGMTASTLEKLDEFNNAEDERDRAETSGGDNYL